MNAKSRGPLWSISFLVLVGVVLHAWSNDASGQAAARTAKAGADRIIQTLRRTVPPATGGIAHGVSAATANSIIDDANRLMLEGRAIEASERIDHLASLYSTSNFFKSVQLRGLARSVRWVEPDQINVGSGPFSTGSNFVSPNEAVIYQLINDSEWGAARFKVVKREVRGFMLDFAGGYRNPDDAFQLLRSVDAAIAAGWEQAPQAKRVAIIGSGKDEAAAHALAKQIRAAGGDAFFFKFCQEIDQRRCANEVVGAFMATAGHVIVMNSDNAVLSNYVGTEVAVAMRLQSGRRLPIMLTRNELVTGATVTTTSFTAIAFEVGRPS